MSGLDNYRLLLTRVDELCGRTAGLFEKEIACRPGCDACCRHLSICAVEAHALREALAGLAPERAELVREKARFALPDGSCPLLHDGLCLIYHARPIICRTHGLALLLSRDGATEVDFCPENFRGLSSIPGSAVIDLDRLNAALAAINALFLQSFPGPERVTMAEALLPTD